MSFFSFLSGILLFLSFPKFGSTFVAWVALIPLLYTLHNTKSWFDAFSKGFLSGITANALIFYWIVYVVVNYGYLPYFAGISAMLLLSAYLGMYIATFAAGVFYFQKINIPLIIAAPLLWTSLEYAKSNLLTGFPWANLAYSQYQNIYFIQILDIIGPYGITFLIVMVNVVLFNTLQHIIYKNKAYTFLKEIFVVSILFLIIYAYGFWCVNNIETKMKVSASLEAAIAQGNFEQDIKWNPSYQWDTINTYKALSLDKRLEGSKLIVWPETATPFYFQDVNYLHREVINTAKASNSWMLIGSPSYLKKSNKISYMNSAFIISPEGNIEGRYDKVHLVPYGEYVPLRKYFPFIDKLVEGVGDFSPGDGFHPLLMNNHKVGILICYEGIFPYASRIYKKAGTQLLVNITNDAWFGKTSAPYQHLSMTVFRAVENRLYVVRAANTGISAFIDPLGRIVSSTNLFERTVLRETIKFMDIRTVYEINGDYFVYMCILLLAIMIVKYEKRRKENV